MNKYIKFPLVLGTVALLSGALLATTYQLTKEKIEQGVIDRQTSAIDDLFDNIDSKQVLEVPSEFASKGVTSIVEVKSNSKVYKCFTINYKDSAEGDNITVIIALTSDAKVYGIKFVTVDSYISNYYNNDKYLASVAKKDNFDVVSGATFSANDLNAALKIAKDCLGGKVTVDPIQELFGTKITKKEVSLPTGIDSSIKKVYTIVSQNLNYYVFDVEFNDTVEENKLKVLYALNEDGSLFKIKVTLGDGYAKLYDGKTDLDAITDATVTGGDLNAELTKINEAYKKLTSIDVSAFFANVTSQEDISVPVTYNKIKEIVKVVSDGQTYYLFRVKRNDSWDNDALTIDYALNESGDLYKIKVVDGDGFAKQYDGKTDLDIISDATYTGQDINNEYDSVRDCLEEVK